MLSFFGIISIVVSRRCRRDYSTTSVYINRAVVTVNSSRSPPTIVRSLSAVIRSLPTNIRSLSFDVRSLPPVSRRNVIFQQYKVKKENRREWVEGVEGRPKYFR